MNKINKIFTSFLLFFVMFAFAIDANALEFKRRQGGELYVFGGDYLGDESGNSWTVGGAYSFQFTETWGASLMYSYTPINAVSGSPLDKDFRSKQTHIITPLLVINNPIIMKTGKTTVSCDLFLTLGTGPMRINDYWEPTGVIGGGIRVYLSDWATLRFDVNSYIHPTRRGGNENVNADMAMMGGFGLLIPTIKSYEKNKDGTITDK